MLYVYEQGFDIYEIVFIFLFSALPLQQIIPITHSIPRISYQNLNKNMHFRLTHSQLVELYSVTKKRRREKVSEDEPSRQGESSYQSFSQSKYLLV